MRKVRDGIRLVEQDGGGWFAQREPPPVPAPQETWNRDHHCRQARRRPSARAMGEGHGPAGLTEEEWLEQPRQAWEQTANRALKDMRRSDVRRHVTLPQSWIQRENWEFETHRVIGVDDYIAALRVQRVARISARTTESGTRRSSPLTRRPSFQPGLQVGGCAKNR